MKALSSLKATVLQSVTPTVSAGSGPLTLRDDAERAQTQGWAKPHQVTGPDGWRTACCASSGKWRHVGVRDGLYEKAYGDVYSSHRPVDFENVQFIT